MRKCQSDSVPVIGHTPEQRGKPLRKNQSHVPSGICPTSKRVRKLSYVGPTLLDSVTEYLYEEAQKVRHGAERDAFTLALAICGAVRRGESDPVASAAYKAFGSTFDRYLKYRAQKQWLWHQELMRCIPDYDPEADHANVEPASEVRRQEALPGNLYQMPSKTKPPQPEPVRRVSRKSAVD